MDDIEVHVLGDLGPFSRTGKSVGYKLQIGNSSFIFDCGAPLFQQIGGHGLKEIEGVIITHCHEDHKRWLGDLAIFYKYAPDMQKKVRVLTTESVYRDLREATAPALTTTLSNDAKRVLEMPYEEFIEHRLIGPRARYRIVSDRDDNSNFSLRITDSKGDTPPPEIAKIIINPVTSKARMLFRDPVYGEWVEPESFYPFSSTLFYEEDKNIYATGDGALLEAINAPVWHGIASMGLKISKGGETLVFSSDTVHDKLLWKELCEEKRTPKRKVGKRDFAAASVILGDINDYIERTWSRERYEEAVSVFNDAAVIHDISTKNSVVHTDYEKLANTALKKEQSLLVHCPDRFTSEWTLCNTGKTYKVKRGRFLEVVGEKCYPMNADIYHKEEGRYYVGYRCEKGGLAVYEKDGLLRFASFDGTELGRPLYRVDLYEDISGRYFPALDNTDVQYFERADGKVELLRFNAQGSNGAIVDDQRERLSGKRTGRKGKQA